MTPLNGAHRSETLQDHEYWLILKFIVAQERRSLDHKSLRMTIVIAKCSLSNGIMSGMAGVEQVVA
jgi:hypothetical protein